MQTKIRKTTIIIVSLWIVAQTLIIVSFWGRAQGSDSGAYLYIAKQCYLEGEWYPQITNIYDSYIWAPGFINWLIFQLCLFGDVNVNMVFNLLMNLGILTEVYFLSKRFFSERTASIAVIFYCLLYSNLIIVAQAGTEIPFLFGALSAFCLCLFPKYQLLIAAGILFAFANWVRPLAIVFILVALFYMWREKYHRMCFIALLLPLLVITISIGAITNNKIGYFVCQSTTSGVNLIMTANNAAYGGVATSVLGDKTNIAYIENSDKYTFIQKDSIWKERAFVWIKEHPVKYMKLYMLKLGGLYIEDSWPDRALLGGDGFIDAAAHGNISKDIFLIRIVKMALKSIFYYFIGIMFIGSLIIHRTDIFTNKGFLLLLLLLGTLITCLFSVGPRYHYPFLFVVIIWASYGMDSFCTKKMKLK